MAGDSSDSNEENEGKIPAHNCLHLNKAIQLLALRKVCKTVGFRRECFSCKRGHREVIVNGHAGEEEDDLLYICLRCGQGRCKHHAEAHSKNTQTEVHDVSVILDKWVVWCFKCQAEFPNDATKQLLECVEFLRKRSETSTTAAPEENEGTIGYTGSFVVAPMFPISPSDELGLPRVRGLLNLGNTCFMNATLQCLAQTPFLLPVLEEMKEEGESFRLPGGDVQIGDETVTLKPLEGKLNDWGPLTAALAETLRELQSGSRDVYKPKQLKQVLEKKCPQFAGYVQHDAHELLRQLLDTVRTEDLKRYRSAILDELNLRTKSEREAASERVRLILKAYDGQASDLPLKPSEVFRGELVSTLVCQRCQHATEHIEFFLDLSLPVVADKPVHARRRVSSEDTLSKHQLKKERKRRMRGKNTSSLAPSVRENNVTEGNGERPLAEEENRAGASDASDEDSDANEADDLDSWLEGGDNVTSGPTRPELGPIVARYSPDLKTGVLHSPGSLELTMIKSRSPDSGDDDVQACSASRGDGLCNSESPGGGSDVPNLGSDDNQSSLANAPDGNLDIEQKESLDDRDDSLEQEAAGACAVGSVAEIERRNEERAEGDVGESGYSSEKPGNGNSACVSPSSALDLCGLSVATDSDQGATGGEACVSGGTMASRTYVPSGECTLITCLNQFTAQELLTGNNKVGCENCTERTHGKGGKTLYMDASKQLLVLNPPAILILHLKRFQVFGFTSRKNSEEVKFPTILDLAPYCSVKCKYCMISEIPISFASDNMRVPKINMTGDLVSAVDGTPLVRSDQSEVRYSLYGVVQHSGGMHGGHYVAYVKVRPSVTRDDPRWSFLPGRTPLLKLDGPPDPPPGKWYYVSDSNVQDVKEARVLSSEAYLLFYERIW